MRSILVMLLLASSIFAQTLDDMISPVGHPVVFEDPRHSTELRPIYVHHKIDDKFATEGGDVNIWALQARVKLADNWSFIAVKDGYVDFNPKATLENDEGFANIAAGFKYSPYSCEDEILTTGLTYEIAMGDEEVLQGNGDGLFNPFVSYAKAFDSINLMSAAGFRLPVDSADSTMFDFNVHANYKLGDFYPLVEVGVINVVSEGERIPLTGEGQDFFNIGSSAADSATMVVGGVGARYRLTDDIDFGVIYQFPMNVNNDTRILEHRVTTDFIFKL